MATVATLRDLVSALVDSAPDESELSGVRADMESFFERVSGSGELRDVLLSTVFSTEEKKAVLGDFLKAVSALEITRRFLLLVLEMEKVPALLGSREAVLARLDEAVGKVTAEITSARDLSQNDVDRLSAALRAATGKTVEMSLKVDPSMIGGIKAQVGDKVYDNSVRTQLERIRGVLSPS